MKQTSQTTESATSTEASAETSGPLQIIQQLYGNAFANEQACAEAEPEGIWTLPVLSWIHGLLTGDEDCQQAQEIEQAATEAAQTGDDTALEQVVEGAVADGEVEGSTPATVEEADEHFITQFTTEWNPTGPSSSTNCGPASLAMMMSAKDAMPSGLTEEQQVDHARALMYPDHPSIQTITADGVDVTVLDRDHDLSSIEAAISGIDASGGTGSHDSGWANLDAVLEAEGVVMAYGYLDDDWREKFDSRVGSGDIAHFNAILGKTEGGSYLVCDPMHTGGAVEMSQADLAEFFTDGVPDFVAWR